MYMPSDISGSEGSDKFETVNEGWKSKYEYTQNTKCERAKDSMCQRRFKCFTGVHFHSKNSKYGDSSMHTTQR